MTKNELVVLGLLSEEPMYGYQLYQEVEKREMEHWAQVNLASIYNTLNRLQKDKLILGKGERPGKMPERKVYHITSKGRKRLEDLVQMALNEQKMPQDSFVVGVAFLQGLSKEKILDALSEKKEQLRKVVERIEKIYQEECCKMSYNWKFILETGIFHLRASIKNLDELMRLVKRQKA
ncbi:MAG TPA: PadR family transcriptional regulator [Terriglobales bacterium]|nr:PadR family transcriptional regulator [Terriglobales bacterium]